MQSYNVCFSLSLSLSILVTLYFYNDQGGKVSSLFGGSLYNHYLYWFAKFEFYSPSEHRIGNKSYDLEVTCNLLSRFSCKAYYRVIYKVFDILGACLRAVILNLGSAKGGLGFPSPRG